MPVSAARAERDAIAAAATAGALRRRAANDPRQLARRIVAALNVGIERFDADPAASEYADLHYRPTGLLQRPLVTLHTTGDPGVPYRHELIYFNRAAFLGTDDKLTSIGHSRKLQSRIDGSTLLECHGAGHMVILERHSEVNGELDRLLSATGAEDAR